MGSKIKELSELKKYKKLLFHNKIGMWEWDLIKNQISFDEGIRSLYELKMPESVVAAEVWYQYIHPEDYSEIMANVMDLIHEKSEMSAVFRIITPTGILKHIQTFAIKETNEENIVCKLIGLNFDVSENQSMQKILIEQSKLAHLGQITAGLAHEVNNPLGIIVGKSNLFKNRIMNDKYDKDKFLADIQAIEKNADRIVKIIRSLNTFSRHSINDPFEKVSLLKIIDEASEIFKEKFQSSSINFEIVVDEKINYETSIEARESEILQVLINLLNNSYDSVQEVQNKWIRIDVIEVGHVYEIKVTDSGPQIKPEIAQQMMKPFFTTKPTGQGTGLGLSLALQIIKSHNGTLIYDSAAESTQFALSLNKKIKE
jgi:C4-dicarboxylate-specific signal transduction histidine kinase